MIFGSHGSKDVKGFRDESAYQSVLGGNPMFCHSPESWTELWDGEVFPKGTVEVKTTLLERLGTDVPKVNGEFVKFWNLDWSVTRL